MGEEHLSTTAEALLDEIGEDKTLSDLSPLKQDAFAFRQQAESLYITEGTLKEKIRLEFKISQLYWAYAKYRLYGGIDWRKFDLQLHTLKKRGINAAWVTYRPEFTPISLLGQVISGNGLSEMFAKSKPHEYHYDALEQALCQYRQIANQGGWKPLFFRGRLKPGRAYKIIPALRERLRLSGDYQGCEAPESNLYDTCLKKAVIRFQKRHGLVAKGVIGKTTRKALNVPVEVRIKTIQLNLDRIKWLHQHHAQRSITINIPAFRLFFEEEGVLIQTMRVITGRIKNPTPVFSNIVETIVLNPSWNIPKSIIQKEMIPKLLRDPNAMAKRGIEIHKGWGKNAMKIQGGAVDWTRYRYSKIMPFHFAQVPGYRNALGKVKFLFPNRFSVYMHDTPTKRLFKRNIRAFSHGCIRLQKPRELLKTFSSFNDSIDFQKSQKRLKGNKKAYLKLDNQVPVDIVYLTAYVDYDGVLNFRKDIYGYDKMQLRFYRNW
ncbi:hypothetical protein MNB_SV-3-1355 [hydrothermal vent metagenome]|uniref:L,D-TPase catalytic domain-containing protein n=1 Tax=hydrothermal vent metagenome TaxID=652676 RepID=A0A1W1BUQ2_9ZZZZ